MRHSNKRVRAFEKGNLSHTMFFEAFEKEIQLSNNFIRAFEKETLFVVSTRHCFFQKLHQHKLGADLFGLLSLAVSAQGLLARVS